MDFSQSIDIPGAPISDDENEWTFHPVETGVADHHVLVMRALEKVFAGEIQNLMLFLPPGSAKALALDTPVPTPEGWKTMGTLKVGDQVFDETGNVCRVTWVSPIWRNRPCYTVKTDCGDEIIADKDHEWMVRLCGKPRKPLMDKENKKRHGAPPRKDRDDPMSQFKIKETWELSRRRAKRPMIKRAAPLVLPSAPLPVDPYVLGLWIGDGNSDSPRVTCSIDDQAFIRQEVERLGYVTSDQANPTQFGILGVRGLLVDLGLLNGRGKFIPVSYLRGSEAQRLSLLQGLIDSDGTVCTKRGRTTFCNTNRGLAEGVRELVRSLGRKAGWSESRAVLNGKDCGTAYRVSFYHAEAARLPRKRALCREQYRTPGTYVDVTPAGLMDTVCIEVDSTSHLFLCGRSMTPTHNSTYASVVFPTWGMGRKPGTQIILSSYGSDLARKHGRRARQIVKSKKYTSIFDTRISDQSSAADEWALSNGSEYMSCGILSGITGNRADGLILDDPMKGRAEAESETIRKRTWEAYQDDLLTRLKPRGWQVMILTRWHQDDPAGRILPEDYNGESGYIDGRDGRKWFVLCCPAQCERADDPLGRQIGEYLWPEWFPESHWLPFKRDARTWSSLFQQRPQPEEGTFFQREWFQSAPESLPVFRNCYITSDFAVTEDGGDYTEHAVWMLDPNDDLQPVDWWSGQTTADVWIDALADLILKWKPLAWFGEAGVIRRAVEPFLTKRLLERKAYVRQEWVSPISDKATRARAFQARASMGKVKWPLHTEWGQRVLNQLLSFPAGRHDDAVDCCSLMGMVIDQAHPAIVTPEWKPVDPIKARLDALEKGSMGREPAIEALKSHNPWHRAMEHPAEWRFNTGE